MRRGEKNVTAGQDTDANITRRVRFACWVTETTNTHLEYLKVLEVRQLNAERTVSI